MARSLTDRLIDRIMHRGTVTAVHAVTPRMQAVLVSVGTLDWKPGQQVRVQTGPGLLSPRRTYSVWDYDAAADGGVMELRVLRHGDGPGAEWAAGLRPGQDVVFSGPEGRFTPRPSGYHLFAGEETAAVAFGPMLRALAGAPVYGVVEVDLPEDRLPLELEWRYRLGASAAGSATLVEAVRALDLPDEPGTAYLAGEARTVQAVRAHLTAERGWPRRSVLTKPFWTPGKKGLE